MVSRRLAGLVSTLGLLLVPGGSRADGVPSTITFTARVLENDLPASGAHSFEFKLYDDDNAGEVAWFEPPAILTVRDGVVFHELGKLTALDASIFSGEKLFLELSVDGTTTSPRIPVLSVPYAIRAGVAENAESLGPHAPDDFVTGVTAGAGLEGGGSTGDVSLAVRFDGSGTADTAARSNHNHTSTYLPLGTTLSCPTGKVTGVNATTGNVTCGADPAPGTGLTTGFNVNFAGSGTATTVAHSDHNHQATYLPLGASLGCEGNTVVSGVDQATGSVACRAADGLSIGPSGNVSWGAISSYPAACEAGTAIVALDDTTTCATFDTTPDTLGDDGVVDDGEVADAITVSNGLLHAPAGGGAVGVGTPGPHQRLHVAGVGGGNQTVAKFGDSPGAMFMVHNDPILAANLYFNNGWYYDGDQAGALVDFIGGAFAFRNAPVGTAGELATLTDRMTLTSEGNLAVSGNITSQGRILATGKVVAGNGSGNGNTSGLWLWEEADSNHVIYSANSDSGTRPGGSEAGDAPDQVLATATRHRMRFRNPSSQGWLFENTDNLGVIDFRAADGSAYFAGSVGIGSAAPQAPLDVFAPGKSSHVFVGGVGCNAPFDGISFGPAMVADCAHYSILGNGTNTFLNRPAGGHMFFREGNIDQLHIYPGGNVGIGTTIPQQRLHIAGVGAGNQTVAKFGDTPGALFMVHNAPMIASNMYYNNGWKYDGDEGGSAIYLGRGAFQFLSAPTGTAGTDATLTETMHLSPEGNLLVNGKLTVGNHDNDGNTSGIWLWMADDSNHVIYSANSATGIQPGSSEAGSAPDSILSASNEHRMRFRTATGQGWLFENNNNMSLIDFDSDNGDAYFRGEVSVGGCYRGGSCSDARLKTDIRPLKEQVLARVLRLQPRTFEWKDRVDGKRHIGLIAQEVEAVFPEVVSTPAGGGPGKGLDCTGLNALSVAAIRELKEQVEAKDAALAQENQALAEVNAKLLARLDSVEQRLAAVDARGARPLAWTGMSLGFGLPSAGLIGLGYLLSRLVSRRRAS